MPDWQSHYFQSLKEPVDSKTNILFFFLGRCWYGRWLSLLSWWTYFDWETMRDFIVWYFHYSFYHWWLKLPLIIPSGRHILLMSCNASILCSISNVVLAQNVPFGFHVSIHCKFFCFPQLCIILGVSILLWLIYNENL